MKEFDLGCTSKPADKAHPSGMLQSKVTRGGTVSWVISPAFPIANAANFLVFSSGSEAAAMMSGSRDREESEMARRKKSLCLQRGEAANVRLSWEAIGGKIIVVISHRNMLPTSEHTRARTSPFLCCKSEQSRGRKLHSYKIKQHHTGIRKNTAFSL